MSEFYWERPQSQIIDKSIAWTRDTSNVTHIKNNYTIKVKGLAFLSLERSRKTRKDTKNFVNKPGPT